MSGLPTDNGEEAPAASPAIRGGGPTLDCAAVGNDLPPPSAVWLNVRGLAGKDVAVVNAAEQRSWRLVLMSETKRPREKDHLFCGENDEWQWILGAAAPPRLSHGQATAGVGALVHRSLRGSVVKLHSDRHQLWLRVAEGPLQVPTVYGVVYLPGNNSASGRHRRQLVLEELAARAREYSRLGPLVLGGDWNARLAANGDTVRNAEGDELQRFADDNGLAITNLLGPVRGQPRVVGRLTRRDLRRPVLQESTLDYVLVSRWAVDRVTRLTIVEDSDARVSSDHLPLELVWMPPPAGVCVPAAIQDGGGAVGAPTGRWRTERITASSAARQRYADGMRPHLVAWTQQTQRRLADVPVADAAGVRDVDWLVASLEGALRNGLSQTVGKSRLRPGAKSWMKGGRLLRMIAERNRLRTQCEAVPASRRRADCATWRELVDSTLRAQREVRAEIRRRKRRERERLYQRVEREWSCPRLFYRQAKQLREGRATCAPVSRTKQGALVSALSERLQAARDHYAELGREAPADEHIEQESVARNFDREFAQSVADRLELLIKTAREEADCDELSGPFTEDELGQAMRLLRNGKATGADGIPGECLRYGGEAMRDALLLLFNELWRREAWPSQWTLGLIQPIYKGKGDDTELDNFRPITLLSVVSKLFEIVLNRRLAAWVEEHHALSEEQGGFRTKRGCADQLFVLQEALSSRAERKLPTYVAFLDVKSAYDRVWRSGLWVRLHEVGIRGKPWRMVRAMYDRVRRTVLVDGRRCEEFDVEAGVSQGAVLSPLLYSIFIDGLIRHLKADARFGAEVAGGRLVCLLYADDIALLADNPDTLQTMLDAVSEYAQRWRFRFNPCKSHALVQGTAAEVAAARARRWLLDGAVISTVDEFKYLGTELGKRRGAYTTFFKRLVSAVRRRASDLVLSGCSMNELDARCSARLWNTLARPILEYGAETWLPTATQADELERVQAHYSRRVLGCANGVPRAFACGELGFRSLAARRDELRLRYWQRLRSVPPERLLARVFRQRVSDVQRDEPRCRRSLCHSLMVSLREYELDEHWEQASTEPPPDADQWVSMVRRTVTAREQQLRALNVSQLPTLRFYGAGLMPKLDHMAGYLRRTRNAEGVWIRCRLRADALPLMQVLGRHSDPRWTDRECACMLCAHRVVPQAAAVETAEHFVALCPARALVQLRAGLIGRLRLILAEWEAECADGSAQAAFPPRDVGAVALSALLNDAEGALPTDASGEPAMCPALTRWVLLVLGLERYKTGDGRERSWAPELMQRAHGAAHDFLALMWRARARLIGGVPTLVRQGGRAAVQLLPYERFKRLSVR